MKHGKKFSQEEQQVSETQSRQTTAVREFASPEELLRFDTKQTAVPRSIAERLGRSLQNESVPPRSWWQRWFGRQ